MSEYLNPSEPVIQSRLFDVLKTMRHTIQLSLAACTPAITDSIMVLIGYPTWTEGAKVWGQPVDPGFVTVDALPDARFVTRYRPEFGLVGPLTTGFSLLNPAPTGAAFQATGQTVTGTNFHTFFSANGSLFDAQYTAIVTDTPDTVATAIALSVMNEDVPGVACTASGDSIFITGGSIVQINIGGVGQAHMEVARVARTIQVSVWVSSPYARFQIHDAITSTLGQVNQPWLTLADGGRALVRPRGEKFIDESQLSYNLYEVHLSYYVEYGVIQRAVATQIGDLTLETIAKSENPYGNTITNTKLIA